MKIFNFFKWARQYMGYRLRKDPQLRLVYKANIAVKIYDKLPYGLEDCNIVADDIIKLIFE